MCSPTLRWAWGEHGLAQDSPMPVRSTTLEILVGTEVSSVDAAVVWSGDVTAQLEAWNRWCALQVAHLWDCPDIVRRYLETGDEAIRNVACSTAWSCAKVDDKDLRTLDTAKLAGARNAVWAAARASDKEPHRVFCAYRAAAGATAWVSNNASEGSVWELAMATAKTNQATRLRYLLLRRVLPERLWPLIDRGESVLCDALLEAR